MSETSYQVKPHTRVFRLILKAVFRFLFSLLSRPEVLGMENIPAKGSYLIAINHVSLYEAPFILAYWPSPPEAAGAVDIWSRPGQSWLARLYGGIPVHRGQYDRQVIERMLSALKSGRPLVLAPEGGRSHVPGMRRALPGAAYLIDKAAVPVLPVGIYGATDDFLSQAVRGKRPKIGMKVGQAMFFQPIQGKGEERRIERQINADKIMFQIAELLPPEYRGVYASTDLNECAEENTAETEK